MRRTAILMAALLALAGAARAEDTATEAQGLLAEGDKAFSARDYAGATATYERAAAAAEKAGETETLVEALAMVARGHLIRDEADAGRPFLERARGLVRDDMPLGRSRYLGVLGRFQWKDGDKPAATKTFESMYDLCMRHDLHGRAVDAAHMVAITGTPEQQLAWAHKGIAAAEKGGMDGWLGPLWNNLGVTYHERGDDEKALDAYRKAREYHWKAGNEVSKLAADWAVGMTLRQLKRHAEAGTWLRPVLAWAERLHAEKPEPEQGEWVGLALLELGLIANAEGDAVAARRDLLRARPLLEAVKLAEWHPELWKDLLDALAATAPAVKGPADEDVARARDQMAALAEAIEQYRLIEKKLPESLVALTRPRTGSGLPYLRTVPDDPWGNPYGLRLVDRTRFVLHSFGPDGKPGTADDLHDP